MPSIEIDPDLSRLALAEAQQYPDQTRNLQSFIGPTMGVSPRVGALLRATACAGVSEITCSGEHAIQYKDAWSRFKRV